VFAGEPINGNWTLEITDDVGGDGGTLYSYTVTFSEITQVGDLPVISCPADIVVDNAPGVCGAVVNFADATAVDTEDGVVATSQTGGPASGSVFAVGTTTVSFEATDSDNNTVSCDFTVTVNDTEAPMASCVDMTVEIDAGGTYVLNAADVAAASTDNCGIVDYYFAGSTFETLNGPFA
ncbi:MAG TPA: HYR domain-containing protein, partial [Epsilonproteobacteria bacterium]|nr:HYR domain-containing protein [Campylobacterota bacterium]